MRKADRCPPSTPVETWRAESKIINSGCDWITVTQEHGAKGELLQAIGEALVKEEAERGNKVRPCALPGYHGERAGQAAWGTRPDGFCVRLSSEAARAYWRKVAALSARCTRYDAQITVALERARPGTCARWYREPRPAPSGRGRPPKWGMRVEDGGGETLYLGRPSSELMIRVYDKGVEEESAPPGTVYRCEVQYRGGLADTARRRLLADGAPASCIERHVVAELERTTNRTVADSGSTTLLRDTRTTADLDRKLFWLETQVRPSLEWLAEMGAMPQALKALGIEQLIG